MNRGPYIRHVSKYGWWFAHPRYVRYMAREASCILIGAYTGVITIGLLRLSQGPAAWDSFLAFLQTPVSTGFHLLALAFALYHTTTWFNVTPKAMPLQFGETKVPGGAIIAAHYIVWVIVSAVAFNLAGVGV